MATPGWADAIAAFQVGFPLFKALWVSHERVRGLGR